MGKGAGSPPAAPDPTVTARAQTDSNTETARLQAQLNRVNQVGPTGSITYSQGGQPTDRGTWENDEVAKARASFAQNNPPGTMVPGVVDYGNNDGDNNAGGGFDPNPMQQASFDENAFRETLRGRSPPPVAGQDQWTQTTELSPEQQRLYDLTTQAQTTYGEIGDEQLNAVRGTLSQPDTVDYGQAREQALAAQRARLDPYYAQQEEGMRSRLLNQGLTEGSEGWNRAFGQFNQGRNDALLQADLRAGDTVGQQISQTTALRARPLNEASVLLGGGQVQVPELQGAPGVNVAPTDVLGAYNQQYQGQLAQYNAQQQQGNAAMGGLFGLAGTLGGAAIRKWW